MSNRRRITAVALIALIAIGVMVWGLWPGEIWTGGVGGRMKLDLGGEVTMEFVEILPGEFMMGTDPTLRDIFWGGMPAAIQGYRRSLPDTYEWERPRHRVRITKPFWMGVTEVTQAQYEAVMGKNPSSFKGADNPVENVNWDNAVEFCRRLTEKDANSGVGAGLKPAPIFRLPTEAEWDYACRAGNPGEWCFGDNEAMLGSYAWCNANSGLATHPVGLKMPNAWGLYDMHGNVWEWCSDWFGDYPSGFVTDPTGPSSGSSRVLRGGSWNHNPRYARSSSRNRFTPTAADANYGFRVCMLARTE
ncbi:MAG TPA: formylglycine-generating enzyme family protein [Candidatus Brocadiia bacterium]|nr:formylglycine-generating enzyme family protein [Candidatus Brocadiia bacterium]